MLNEFKCKKLQSVSLFLAHPVHLILKFTLDLDLMYIDNYQET